MLCDPKAVNPGPVCHFWLISRSGPHWEGPDVQSLLRPRILADIPTVHLSMMPSGPRGLPDPRLVCFSASRNAEGSVAPHPGRSSTPIRDRQKSCPLPRYPQNVHNFRWKTPIRAALTRFRPHRPIATALVGVRGHREDGGPKLVRFA